jgi:hypothetical protein
VPLSLVWLVSGWRLGRQQDRMAAAAPTADKG